MQDNVESLLRLLYRISKNNSWMLVTEIIASVSLIGDGDTDEALEKRLIEKYGTYIST